jgi:hypothetical protein
MTKRTLRGISTLVATVGVLTLSGALAATSADAATGPARATTASPASFTWVLWGTYGNQGQCVNAGISLTREGSDYVAYRCDAKSGRWYLYLEEWV